MAVKLDLLARVRACTLCRTHLPLEPRPIVSFAKGATILLTGQAPGLRAHESAVPWNDASGERLRDWMGVTREQFYDPNVVAIVPMGFCYPGKGKSGDLPPRPECAPQWMDEVLAYLGSVRLHIVIGSYAMKRFLGEDGEELTTAVKGWKRHFPGRIPLPHPSPRNNIWLKKNPWFERDVVPALRREVKRLAS